MQVFYVVTGEHFWDLLDPLIFREDGEVETRTLDRHDDLLQDAVDVLLPLTCTASTD